MSFFAFSRTKSPRFVAGSTSRLADCTYRILGAIGVVTADGGLRFLGIKGSGVFGLASSPRAKIHIRISEVGGMFRLLHILSRILYLNINMKRSVLDAPGVSAGISSNAFAEIAQDRCSFYKAMC